MQLLGQIEVDRRDWNAALDAWGELTDRYAMSSEAKAVSPAIRPLQALVECDCGRADATAVAADADEPPTTATSTPDAPSTPTSPAAAIPTPTPTPGLFMIGGWGPEYDAAQEVTRDLIEFLESSGVAVRAGSTEVPAIRGADVVLSYLLEEARAVGAEGVILLTSRFSHRDFIEIARYDLDGREVWIDKTTGGTGLKPRHERDKPNWPLAERAKEKLAKRIGTPDLPTS